MLIEGRPVAMEGGATPYCDMGPGRIATACKKVFMR